MIIGAGAYTPEKAEDLIGKGLIDAVAFGRDYIADWFADTLGGHTA